MKTKEYKIAAGDILEGAEPHLLAKLFPKIEPSLTSKEVVEKRVGAGEMSVEVACLIVSAAVPLISLIYDFCKDISAKRNEKLGESETKKLYITVMFQESKYIISNDLDAKNLDLKINETNRRGPIEVVIESEND